MKNLQVIENQGQRVLTTSQLAESYGTDSKRIANNFGENKDRYTEGKHYFKLEGEELRTFKGGSRNSGIALNVNTLYLWTEKGAWFHAKSLNTDKAWEAYETLVDDYYRIQQQKPVTLEDLIIMQAQSVKELKEKVTLIEERATAAHHRIDNMDAVNTIGDMRQRLNAMVRRYAQSEGIMFPKAWNTLVQSFNTAFHTNLKLLKANYEMKHGKKVSIPEYLAICGKLEDAIRVADKLLNKAS